MEVNDSGTKSGISERTKKVIEEAGGKIDSLGLSPVEYHALSIVILEKELKKMEDQRNKLALKGNLSEYDEAYLSILDSNILEQKKVIKRKNEELEQEIKKKVSEYENKMKGQTSSRR